METAGAPIVGGLTLVGRVRTGVGVTAGVVGATKYVPSCPSAIQPEMPPPSALCTYHQLMPSTHDGPSTTWNTAPSGSRFVLLALRPALSRTLTEPPPGVTTPNPVLPNCGVIGQLPPPPPLPPVPWADTLVSPRPITEM